MRVATMLKIARSGNLRSRMRAVRDAQAAVRLAAVGAGLRTGALDLVAASPGSTADLAERGGWPGSETLEGLLRVLASLGLVAERRGRWQLTGRGRALLDDDVARATYDGFSDFHTGLYSGIEQQLSGGAARRDVVEKGDVIARLSNAFNPFVLDLLTAEIGRRRPRRVLDVGCATGAHLVHMLRAAPDAAGVGIETDPAAAAMARATVAAAGLSDRARIVEGDVREVLTDHTGFDLALLANVIYYLPLDERVPLLRSIAERMEPGGAMVVVTTALTDAVFSRHFDLLLRTQEGAMGLPDIGLLGEQLRQAGLVPEQARRIAPGEPLTAVVAFRA
jgi:SAM-dependent methyltransferase